MKPDPIQVAPGLPPGSWISILLLSLFLYHTPAAAQRDSATEKAVQLEQLQQRIAELRKVLQKVEGRRDDARSALRESEQKIGAISRTLYRLVAKVRAHKEKLDTLRQQHGLLMSKMDRQRVLLAGQVRASYSMGRQEELKILLNQGDPGTMQRSLVYYDYLNRSRVQNIQQATRQLQELLEVEAAIQHEYQQLQQLHAERDQEKEALVTVRGERTKVLEKLGKELSSRGNELERMLADEKELRRILDALEHALSDIPREITNRASFNSRKGKLPWPSGGKLIARFGDLRAMGNMRWSGVKISAANGQNVQVVSHGRVAFADWLRGYGLLLIVDHGDGYMSLYGNNQSLYKEAGEWVEAGEVIASVGDSGGQSSSGLYFEIRKQGKPVDPLQWCRAVSGNRVRLN